MKYLIIILFPICSYSQVTFTEIGAFTTQTTNSTDFGYTNLTLQVGRLYLFIAQTTGTTNPGTITATSLTWTSVASVGNSTNRIQVFRCSPSVDTEAENLSIGSFGGGSTGNSYVLYEITGVITTGTNGADAIVQAVTQTATTGTNPTITLAALSSSRASVMGIFSNDANPFTATEESGWAEIYDVGYATPTTGYYETRRHLTSDNSVSITAASSTWIGVAIELKQSGRRVFNIE